MVQRGLERVKLFSREEEARRTFKVYQEVSKGPCAGKNPDTGTVAELSCGDSKNASFLLNFTSLSLRAQV